MRTGGRLRATGKFIERSNLAAVDVDLALVDFFGDYHPYKACPNKPGYAAAVGTALAARTFLSNPDMRLHAAVPLQNPEAFFQRVSADLLRVGFSSVFDVNHPRTVGGSQDRLAYSSHANSILTMEQLAALIDSGKET